MRIVVIQLSDLHARDAHNPVLGRTEAIVDAVRGLDFAPGLYLVALTGDMTFSGTAAQFDLVSKWVEDLVARLKLAGPQIASVRVVACPGNHDCDFSSPTPARTRLIESMRKDTSIVDDPTSIYLQ